MPYQSWKLGDLLARRDTQADNKDPRLVMKNKLFDRHNNMLVYDR